MPFSCECVSSEVSASGWSLLQGSPTDCVVSLECDRRISAARRPWPKRGCREMKKHSPPPCSYER